MNRIIYGKNGTPLRIELDATPNASKVTLTGPGGEALLAATAATLLTATTTTAAVAVGDEHVDCTSVAGMAVGDRLWLATSAAGPGEALTIRHIDTVAKIVYTRTPFEYDHTSGVAVSGLFLTYSLNASSATDYPKGRQVTASWRDETTLDVWTQVYEVVYGIVDYGKLSTTFSQLYPTTWESTRDRWDAVVDYATLTVKHDVAAKGRMLDRLRDEDAALPLLLSKCRVIALIDSGDTDKTERDEAAKEYVERLNVLCAASEWWDADQDLIHEEEEIQTTEPWFGRGL
jgi:hypothetical protein